MVYFCYSDLITSMIIIGSIFMARPLRIDYPGAYYHITTRGVGCQIIFFDESDRQIFLEILLGEMSKRWGIIIHGYFYPGNIQDVLFLK